jgi:hypothetical protein
VLRFGIEPEVELGYISNNVLIREIFDTCFSTFLYIPKDCEYVAYFPRISVHISRKEVDRFVGIMAAALPDDSIKHPANYVELITKGVAMKSTCSSVHVNIVFRTYRLLQEQPEAVKNILAIFPLLGVNKNYKLRSSFEQARIAICIGAIAQYYLLTNDYPLKYYFPVGTPHTYGHYWANMRIHELRVYHILNFLTFEDRLEKTNHIHIPEVTGGSERIMFGLNNGEYNGEMVVVSGKILLTESLNEVFKALKKQELNNGQVHTKDT